MIGKGIETPLAGLVDNNVSLYFSPFLNNRSYVTGKNGNGTGLIYDSEIGIFIFPGGDLYTSLVSLLTTDSRLLQVDAMSDSQKTVGLNATYRGKYQILSGEDFSIEISKLYYTSATLGIMGIYDGSTTYWFIAKEPLGIRFIYLQSGISYSEYYTPINDTYADYMFQYRSSDGSIFVYRNGSLLSPSSTTGAKIPNVNQSANTGYLQAFNIGGDFFARQGLGMRIGDYRISKVLRSAAEHNAFRFNCFSASV